ncbi:hypothetical protein Geob_3757 [Geotalea daltonii FRC-32]|uniref:Pvc16 N-terminal domain-containing protein n=1 Tax=Geotalea daltonii (strain DSM 22248 / JCM 15807 / FRC-32) TaxID=316067 RepID=B9M7I9_GEODF|nr:DUF4255 domain-containing protein [Geotalea daltonii]ACM22095.1 hypothetical protein Geob_3757 [Geotalea daltonii FRC-32]
MLDVALQFLSDEINAYSLTSDRTGFTKVKLGPVVNGKGEYAIDSDTIGLSIINIEEERVLKSQTLEHRLVGDQHVVLEPELKLNIYLLFAANYTVYDVALKAISHIISFFQSRPSFTSEQYPALDRQIAKLSVELQSPSYEQLNQIWGFIGAKQLPSVLYKVRMITIQDGAVKTVKPPVTKIQGDTNSQ